MRLNAMIKFQHFADVYDWTPLNNGTNEVSYKFALQTVCSVSVTDAGPRIVVLAPIPLRKGMQITNIVDRNGADIVPGAIFVITAVVPNVDALGNSNGFKMTAAMSVEPTFTAVT